MKSLVVGEKKLDAFDLCSAVRAEKLREGTRLGGGEGAQVRVEHTVEAGRIKKFAVCSVHP